VQIKWPAVIPSRWYFEPGTFAFIFVCFARIIWMMCIAKRLFSFGQLSSCLVGDHRVLKFLSRCRQRQLWMVSSDTGDFVEFAICCRPSVCRLSVTFVCPTQAVQIFRNISTALGTLAIHWHPLKISRRSSQGNPSAGGVIHKRGSQVTISDLSTAISQKRCKIRGKLVLITDRKSYMSFRLVPKLVTLNELERHNGVILRYFS